MYRCVVRTRWSGLLTEACGGCPRQADVNVASWNALAPHTLASGGDDGRLRVWDLRAFSSPVADFRHHRCPPPPPPPRIDSIRAGYFPGHWAPPLLVGGREGSGALLTTLNVA